jgi:RHS repeat-associated protein
VQSPTTVGLTYNLAGELTQENYTGGPLNGLSVTNGYDHWMRRTNVVLRSGGSSLHAASYYYDEASRLRMVASGSANAGYSYLANSPLVSQIAFTNSGVQRMVTTKQYDLLNRLENIKSVPSGSGAASFAYTYNRANQRSLRREADGSYWRYEYDAIGQVVSGNKYWADGTPVAGQQFQYAFDDIGNRLSTKAGGDEYGANLRTNAYYPNLLNQYTSRTIPGAADVIGVGLATNTVTVNGLVPYRKGEYFRKELTVANSSTPVWQAITVAATGQTSVSGNTWVPRTPEAFGYDSDGNLTNDGRWAYTWDAENRLRIMVPNTAIGLQSKLAFDYDARGRRIRKQVWNNPAGTGSPTNDLRFVYDGWNLIGTLNSSLSLLNSYAWGLDLSGNLQGAGGVGGLVVASEILNGVVLNSYLPAFDGNGNVAALIKAGDGTESARYEYGPFGEVIRMTGSIAKAHPLRFSTKYQDDETELVYYGYRYYNASTGRWVSRDPLEEDNGPSLLAFCRNEPIKHFDILGLWRSRAGFTEHRQLTEASFNDSSAAGILPCPGQVLRILQDADDAQDNGNYLDMLERHYNRPYIDGESPSLVRANRQRWHRMYQRAITSHLIRFDMLSSAYRCREALQVLGSASHLWQDYYAHAVHETLAFAGDSFSGSPDQAAGPYWPSSYAGFWKDAEHPPTYTAKEPPFNDAQRGVRWNGAIRFVAGKYNGLLERWQRLCYCACTYGGL